MTGNVGLRALIKSAAERASMNKRGNPYAIGFLSKCAEYGVSEDIAVGLLNKVAADPELPSYGRSAGVGAGVGAGLGALSSLATTGLGAGLGYLIPTSGKNDEEKNSKRRRNALIGAIGGLGLRNAALGIGAYKAQQRAGMNPSVGNTVANFAKMLPFDAGGGLVGAGIGALSANNKKDRIRRALKGAIYGDLMYRTGGGALGGALAGVGVRSLFDAPDAIADDLKSVF